MRDFLARFFLLSLMLPVITLWTACATDSELEDDEIVTASDDPDVEDEDENSSSQANEGKGDDEENEDEFDKFASEKEEDEPDGDLTAEDIPDSEIPETEELSEEEETFVQDFGTSGGEGNSSVTTGSSTPAIDSWTPNNNGPAPTPVNQADLKIQCQRVGSGLEPGYYRYGCNAFRHDGKHHGIVKGWWNIRRQDGLRAKSKSLNFREGGYDMAFDVLASDADSGIQVSPGVGEQPPFINGKWGP